jgi:hypothetical protein
MWCGRSDGFFLGFGFAAATNFRLVRVPDSFDSLLAKSVYSWLQLSWHLRPSFHSSARHA